MEKENCSNCKFWEWFGTVMNNGLKSDGYCRRYPPNLKANLTTYRNTYPTTASGYWCGEYKPNV